MKRLIVLALLGLALATATTAKAGPPTFQTVEVDFYLPPDPATTAQCGFPVEVRGIGTIKLSIHEQRNGKVVKIERFIHSGVAFTNVDTGFTYTSHSAGPSITVTNPDGTSTTAGMGIFDIEIVQGRGVLWKNVGRIVWDQNGNVVFEAGSHPAFTGGDISGLCEALS